MSRSSELSVPSFSRSRSTSQSSSHSNPEAPQEHPTVTPEEPLLAPTNTSEQLSQSRPVIPQIDTTTIAGDEKHRGRFSEAFERLEETWYIEAFFLLCSASCAVLIVTFLVVHDNTNIESWRFRFASINTVVSALGTVFKSTLLMAVSAAVAQGKWTWFRKRSGTLSTFQAIDAGSRDTIESFRLLYHTRGQYLVSAGALVMALGFMIEPFLQQTISDSGRLDNTDTSKTSNLSATIGRSRRFDGGTQCISTYPDTYPQVDTTPDFAIGASLYDGLNAALTHGYQNVSFTCMFGNCTWPKYVSIAVRSTCFDISDHLRRTDSEDQGRTTASTTGTPASSSLSATTQEPPQYGAPSSLPTPAAVTQEPSVYEVPSSTADSLTALTAFEPLLTTESEAAPITSTATRYSETGAGLDKRASSDTQSPSMSPSPSPATGTDWTLEHLNLTLSNTDPQLRQANTFAVLQAAAVADPNLTINFKVSQTLLAAFTIIRADDSHPLGSADWDAADASATECGLELALNVYNSSVVNNILLEQIVASVSQKVPGSWLPSPGIDQSGVHPDGLEADPGTLESNPIYHDTFLYRDDYALDPTHLQMNDTNNFSITQRTLISTADFLTSLIPQANGTVKAVLQKDSPTLYAYGSPILQPLLNQTNTTATFGYVAKSMSNAIRNLGTEPMTGTTKRWVRFYQVRWAYLALPLSLIAIGTTFFILSIIEAHRVNVPNWKANSVATMIHGPDELLRRHLRTENHIHSLGVASETRARLEPSLEGYALTAANQLVPEISRPTTPARDEEEQLEMDNLKPPGTPSSVITLVDPQNAGAAGPEYIRPVSPIGTGPGWSDIPIDEPTTPLGIRRTS